MALDHKVLIEKVICYVNANKRMYNPWGFREIAEILHLLNVSQIHLIWTSRFRRITRESWLASQPNLHYPETGSHFICFRPSRTLSSSQQTWPDWPELCLLLLFKLMIIKHYLERQGSYNPSLCYNLACQKFFFHREPSLTARVNHPK